MKLSYNKLWKLLIDKGMTKTEMRLKADISITTLAKLGKNETVSMEVLLKIVRCLNVRPLWKVCIFYRRCYGKRPCTACETCFAC